MAPAVTKELIVQFTSYRQAAALVAAFIAIASATAQTTDQTQLAMAVTQDACEAFRTGNVAAVERLLAPGFTLVGSNAQVQSRAEVLAEVRGRDPQYEVFRNHSMTAQVYGNAAIVQGITNLKGTSGGKSFEADVRFTDTLIRDKGRWRIVVSHVTRIPAR
jgi:ketosteroid isomerase-like protein